MHKRAGEKAVEESNAAVRRQFTNQSQNIPKNMVLVERLVDRFESLQPFAGQTALLIQHQLGNQVPQIKAMIALGLAPENIHWLDIPYTSNAVVREELVRMKIPHRNLVVGDYELLDYYAAHQRLKVQKSIRWLLDYPPEQLLVLDDGAYFLDAATRFSRFADRLGHTAIVEQTTRGLIKIRANGAIRQLARTMPIVNVAGSKPKGTLEPFFIAHAVYNALNKKLKKFNRLKGQARCLILGYGNIGKAVASFLSEQLNIRKTRIHLYDPRLLRSQLDGFLPWNRDDTSTRFDLVVGCSGQASFQFEDHIYLNDGAVLASASSGSVELSRRDFIEIADESNFDDIEIDRSGLDLKNIHSDIPVRILDKEIVILNGGFPINFDGRVNCVPAQYIQPTMAMMVMASIQAIAEKRQGLVGLNGRFCKELDREFRAFLGDRSHILPPSPYS